jgi:hypothetical protein
MVAHLGTMQESSSVCINVNILRRRNYDVGDSLES